MNQNQAVLIGVGAAGVITALAIGLTLRASAETAIDTTDTTDVAVTPDVPWDPAPVGPQAITPATDILTHKPKAPFRPTMAIRGDPMGFTLKTGWGGAHV